MKQEGGNIGSRLEAGQIKQLPERFRKNELPYTLIKCNEVVALYGVGGTYTDKILHYEVCELHLRNDQFGRRLSLPSNEQYGRDGSRAILNREEALAYFEELTGLLNTPAGTKRAVRGRDKTSEGYQSPASGLTTGMVR